MNVHAHGAYHNTRSDIKGNSHGPVNIRLPHRTAGKWEGAGPGKVGGEPGARIGTNQIFGFKARSFRPENPDMGFKIHFGRCGIQTGAGGAGKQSDQNPDIH